MLAKVFVGLTLASSALATVFITAPFESTSYSAGQEAMIQWQDDGSGLSLEDFGLAKFSIYTGNANEQTLLQELESVDVSQVSSISFVPSASIGPDSNQYFIRVESLSAKDPKNPSIPALAFSSRFSLDGMSGEFSDVASSQIAAQSTAPLTKSSSSPSTAASSGSGTVKPTGSASAARLATSISGKSGSATSTSPMSMSSKASSSSFSFSTPSPPPPSTVSSAPTDLASAITVPASSAVLSAQMYTGLIVTLLGALAGVMIL